MPHRNRDGYGDLGGAVGMFAIPTYPICKKCIQVGNYMTKVRAVITT